MARRGPLVFALVLAAAFLVGSFVRGQLDLELSVDSIRSFVSDLGWWAPVIFIALVTFRQFLLLPSALLLTAGGVAFGAGTGTVLGAAGVILSALMKFGLARVFGRDWLEARYGDRFRQFDRRLGKAGPLAVGVSTAHPTGPLSPFHWGAGFSSMSVGVFAAVVIAAAPIRAAALSFFGAHVFEPGTPRFWVASGILVATVLVPLLHPGLRRRILGWLQDLEGDQPEAPGSGA